MERDQAMIEELIEVAQRFITDFNNYKEVQALFHG
jgi:hypothetical protein